MPAAGVADQDHVAIRQPFAEGVRMVTEDLHGVHHFGTGTPSAASSLAASLRISQLAPGSAWMM